MIHAGLDFAAADYVTLQTSGVMAADGIHASGTHLKSSLQDLHKLGVDAAGHAINNLGVDVVDVSGIAGLQDLNALTASLKEAGVDHLGLHSTDLFDQGQETNLLAAFESGDWLNQGVDITLEIDAVKAPSLPTAAVQADLDSGLSDNEALNALVLHGMDLLGAQTQLSAGQTWGTLIHALQDSGLGNVEIESKASVHIGDDLSAALYESGMLHALPDANLEIDVAANTKLLSTSLKAMADLGVDKVHANDKVFVKLGVTEGDLADMHDLFSAFGLDNNTAVDHSLFANNGAGAGLLLDEKTAQTLGITPDHYNEAKVADLVEQLAKLGITEVDVVNADSTDGHVYTLNVGVVAQTAMAAPAVELLGTDHAQGDVFDQDIKTKPFGH